MRILCLFSHCGPYYVRRSWGKVFEYCGHEFHFWDQKNKSAHDAFGEVEPDIFLGTTYDLDRATFKNIAARPQMKVALFASAWSPYLKDIDLQKYPIVVASEQEKATIAKLKKETGRPDFVFIHVTERFLAHTMSGWKDIGVTPVGVLNAADVFTYYQGKFKPELQCDVGFCGGYWPYKARNLDTHILPLCSNPSLSVKIFGNQPWPVAQYLGSCSDEDSRDLFVSATVCPNVSEPHSTDLGWDLIERPLKVLSSGGFCLSDYVEEAKEIFTEDELPMRKGAQNFINSVMYYVENPASRNRSMELGKKKVLAEHTYFDRVAQFWTGFGMPDEAVKTLEMKNKFLGKAAQP